MALNFANLPNSAFVENSAETGWVDIYPAGTLFIAENGLSYRALQPFGDAEDGMCQMFVMQHPDGERAIVATMAFETRVVWYPNAEEK